MLVPVPVRSYDSILEKDTYSINRPDSRIIGDRDINQLVQEVLRSMGKRRKPMRIESGK